MKIEAKFDTEQEVWYMKDNKPVKEIIQELNINKRYEGSPGGWVPRVKYLFIPVGRSVRDTDWIDEPKVFATKEELLKSL